MQGAHKMKKKCVGNINDLETNYFLRYEKTNENLILIISSISLAFIFIFV